VVGAVTRDPSNSAARRGGAAGAGAELRRGGTTGASRGGAQNRSRFVSATLGERSVQGEDGCWSLDDALLERLAAICRREGWSPAVPDAGPHPGAAVAGRYSWHSEGRPQERAAELFLGVGDPIYNRAERGCGRAADECGGRPGLEFCRDCRAA